MKNAKIYRLREWLSTCLGLFDAKYKPVYLSWDAFARKSKKVNLIKYLIFRAFKICLNNKIKSEFEQIKSLFLGNGYPREVIVDPINKTIYKFRKTAGHLALLNAQFMLDDLGLDLLASWLPIRFLPLLHAVRVQLWLEPSLQLKLHFTLFIWMCSLSSNKAI